MSNVQDFPKCTLPYGTWRAMAERHWELYRELFRWSNHNYDVMRNSFPVRYAEFMDKGDGFHVVELLIPGREPKDKTSWLRFRWDDRLLAKALTTDAPLLMNETTRNILINQIPDPDLRDEILEAIGQATVKTNAKPTKPSGIAMPA